MADPGRYPLLASMRSDVGLGEDAVRLRAGTTPRRAHRQRPVRVLSGERVLLIDTEEFGVSAFPGGMLEPGEDWTPALERELLEEGGARPLSIEVVGRIHFWSGLDAPYRPHLPHPEFHQVVAYSEVELVGTPTNPPGGEHVTSVELIPIGEVMDRLRAANPFGADLLSFVADVREAR